MKGYTEERSQRNAGCKKKPALFEYWRCKMMASFRQAFRSLLSGLAGAVVPILLLGATPAAGSNLVDEEKEIYLVQPVITEPAWTQTGAYLKSFLFDMPDALSRPNAQVGFVFTPGFTWSVFDILEVNLGFPLVLNPDETGDRELEKAETDPRLKLVPTWDNHPDFDLPGLLLGLKGNLLGQEAGDRFFLAVGVLTSLSLFEKWATNFLPPKNSPNHSSSWRINPYLSLAYAIGRFSPQLQVGASIRLKEDIYDPETDEIRGKGYTDFFFNLALPFALPFEGTAPLLEINGVWNPEEGTQVFITPAVTFMPGNSPASLGFACMFPVLDSSWRKNEGFRFLVSFSYRFDALGIPAPEKEKTGGTSTGESPPSGW